MNYEEIRTLIMDFFANPPKETIQYLDVVNGVGDMASKMGLISARLENGDIENIRAIIWELIIERLLIPGANPENPEWPFLSVTEFGRTCFREEQILPYDPDRYLERLQQEIPTLNDTMKKYILESLQCFQRGLYNSSTIMLGVSSEKAILLLIDSFENAISDETAKINFHNDVENLFIRKKYSKFRTYFDSILGTLPTGLKDDLENKLDGIFSLIRNQRNAVGHPTGITIDRCTAYANLQLFIPYCKKIYDLIDHFINTVITI